MHNFIVVGVLVLFTTAFSVVTCNIRTSCNRIPSGAVGSKSDPTNKFRITIDKDPVGYTPEKMYTVILQGDQPIPPRSEEKPFVVLFNGFSLIATLKNKTSKSPEEEGLFHHAGDKNTKIDEKCPNMVVHAAHVFVTKVRVNWKAPAAGSGCVLFKAAVMDKNFWYMDDKGLTYEFCEKTNTEQFETVDRCCACSEATYEMKFEGLWTRQSHPKAFPNDLVWLTRFSDVIGVSHTVGYKGFWQSNNTATDGLAHFCESDNSTTLEAEIKKNGTRTVIKAKGIGYPNITGKTFAVFRVDPEHHLLSVLSMIRPSPDWFVGISGLELCEESCTWVKSKTLDLLPWDLGLYDDITFNSRKNKTQGGLIQRIEPSDNPDSPFYEESDEEIKPMARLYLTFEKQYEKDCQNKSDAENDTANNIQATTDNLSEIVSNPLPQILPKMICAQDAYICDCKRKKNVPKEDCIPVDDCECNDNKECETTKWGEWTNCSTPNRNCGENVKARFREFTNFSAGKNCNLSALQETKPCGKEKFSQECRELELKCEMLPWSIFEPCKLENTLCTRHRRRKLNSTATNDQKCALLVSQQTVFCDPDECVRNLNEQRLSRIQTLKN